MIKLPLDDRHKIDLVKPVFTLDVNQIAIKPPASRPPGYEYLAYIEYNYFETGLVEAAVTPETNLEITQGLPEHALGWQGYQRLTKSQWFKARPSGSTLPLNEQDANELWTDMRWRLWPTASGTLTNNQRADVNQLFFHTVSSGSTATNSAFVTYDHNFINRADVLHASYGIHVLTPQTTWESYSPRYSLLTPTTSDVDDLYRNQQELLARIRAGMI